LTAVTSSITVIAASMLPSGSRNAAALSSCQCDSPVSRLIVCISSGSTGSPFINLTDGTSLISRGRPWSSRTTYSSMIEPSGRLSSSSSVSNPICASAARFAYTILSYGSRIVIASPSVSRSFDHAGPVGPEYLLTEFGHPVQC